MRQIRIPGILSAATLILSFSCAKQNDGSGLNYHDNYAANSDCLQGENLKQNDESMIDPMGFYHPEINRGEIAPPPAAMSAEEAERYRKHRQDAINSQPSFESLHPNWESGQYHQQNVEYFTLASGTGDHDFNHISDSFKPKDPETQAEIDAYNQHLKESQQWYDDWNNGGSKAYHDQWYKDNADQVQQWEEEHKRIGFNPSDISNDALNSSDVNHAEISSKCR